MGKTIYYCGRCKGERFSQEDKCDCLDQKEWYCTNCYIYYSSKQKKCPCCKREYFSKQIKK